jgi:hypothetical protein
MPQASGAEISPIHIDRSQASAVSLLSVAAGASALAIPEWVAEAARCPIIRWSPA